MKKFSRISGFMLAIAACTLIFSNCISPYAGENDTSLTIILPGASDARAAWGTNVDIGDLDYTISLSGPDGLIQVPSSTGQTSYTVSISPGTWTVTVTATKPSTGEYAVANETVNILPGHNTPIQITLKRAGAYTIGFGGFTGPTSIMRGSSASYDFTANFGSDVDPADRMVNFAVVGSSNIDTTITPSSGTYSTTTTSILVTLTVASDETASSLRITASSGAEKDNQAAAYIDITVTDAPIITITTQPTATTNILQGNTGTLTVVANISAGGGSLSYQWYSNNTNSNSGGDPILSANTATLTIPTDASVVGTRYYYCEVSATGAVSKISNVATVVVVPPTLTGTITITANNGINSNQPSLSGAWIDGQALTASLAAGHNGSGTATWVWRRGTTVISNLATYTLAAADLGQTLTVEVSYSNNSESVQSPVYVHPGTRIADLAGLMAMVMNNTYILTNDITIPTTWTPLGNLIQGFIGTLDGNGKTITWAPGSRTPSNDQYGIFRVLGEGGTVKNLRLAGELTLVRNDGSVYAGAIAGELSNNSIIRNVSSSVNVSVTASGGANGGLAMAGGIAGVGRLPTIENSYSTGDIRAISGDRAARAAGIVVATNSLTINNTWASGTVEAEGASTPGGGSSNSVNAAGISAGEGSTWINIRNSVALQTSISAINNTTSTHILIGRIAASQVTNNWLNNHANSAMLVNGVTESGVADNDRNGANVDLSATLNENWWRNIANWESVWGTSETAPWKWGAVGGIARPVLWFE